MQGGKGIGQHVDVTIPRSLQGKIESKRIDSRSLACNLFHTVLRLTLSQDSYKVDRRSVLLDSNPIAIPLAMLDKETMTRLTSSEQVFTTRVSKEDCEDTTESIAFAMNPVFCLYLLHVYLTQAGNVPVEEAVKADTVITCALLPFSMLQGSIIMCFT